MTYQANGKDHESKDELSDCEFVFNRIFILVDEGGIQQVTNEVFEVDVIRVFLRELTHGYLFLS